MHGTQRVIMPKADDKITFKDGCNQAKVPFVIYADFECSHFNKSDVSFENPCGDPSCTMCEEHKKLTVREASQEANSYCDVIVRSDGLTSPPVLYRGKGAASHLLRSLDAEIDKIFDVFDNPKPLVVTTEILKAKDDADALGMG